MPVKTSYLVGTSLELLLTQMNWCKVVVCLWTLYIHSLCVHSRKLREAGPSEDGIYKIGNDIFSVKADLKLNQCLNQSQNQPVPLFGAKYNFWLHEVVDLPEYLIHMPLLHRSVNTTQVFYLTLHPHTTPTTPSHFTFTLYTTPHYTLTLHPHTASLHLYTTPCYTLTLHLTTPSHYTSLHPHTTPHHTLTLHLTTPSCYILTTPSRYTLTLHLTLHPHTTPSHYTSPHPHTTPHYTLTPHLTTPLHYTSLHPHITSLACFLTSAWSLSHNRTSMISSLTIATSQRT